jgi:hypothetical protein
VKAPRSTLLRLPILLVLSAAIPAGAEAAEFKPGHFKTPRPKSSKATQVDVWVSKKRVNDIDYSVFQNRCNLGPGYLHGRIGGQVFTPTKEYFRFARLTPAGSFRYVDRFRAKGRDEGNNLRTTFFETIVAARVSGRRITGTIRWKAKTTFLGVFAPPGTKPTVWRCRGEKAFTARWRDREVEGPGTHKPKPHKENVPENGDWELYDEAAGQQIFIHLDDNTWTVSPHADIPGGCGATWGEAKLDVGGDTFDTGDIPVGQNYDHSLNDISGTVRVVGKRVGTQIRGSVTWNVNVSQQGSSPCTGSLNTTWQFTAPKT